MSTRDDKNIQFSEYAGKFTDQVNNADKLRTEAMQRLQSIRNARQKSQQRQLKKVTEKFGETHPRTLHQIARIDSEKHIKSFLAVAVSKATVEVAIPDGSFVFQGRILSDDIRGVAGVVVQLQDARNNPVGRPVKADKNGAYSLVLDIDESFKLTQLSAVVLDAKGTQIHKETLPVLVKPNAVELRDIVIVSTDKPSRDGFSTPAGDLQIKKQVTPKATVVPKKKIKKQVAPKATIVPKKTIKKQVTPKATAAPKKKIKKQVAPKATVAPKRQMKNSDDLTIGDASTPKAKVATKKVVRKRVVRKADGKSTK